MGQSKVYVSQIVYCSTKYSLQHSALAVLSPKERYQLRILRVITAWNFNHITSSPHYRTSNGSAQWVRASPETRQTSKRLCSIKNCKNNQTLGLLPPIHRLVKFQFPRITVCTLGLISNRLTAYMLFYILVWSRHHGEK